MIGYNRIVLNETKIIDQHHLRMFSIYLKGRNSIAFGGTPSKGDF
jgi:hypothetical protein